MNKTILFILLITVLTASCLPESKKQSPSETDLKFSEALITNFSNEVFLKEEEHLATAYIEKVKRAPETYHELGINLFYKEQNLAGAITVFKKFAEVYPENQDAISMLAVLYVENKDKKAAIESYTLALELSKKSDSDYKAYYQSELDRLQRRDAKPGLDILYEEAPFKFTLEDKQLIDSIIIQSEKEIRALLPKLTENIRLVVTIIDRNIDEVGGVTGRAETHMPGEILVEISNVFPGGIKEAAKTALASTLFHEIHHIYRGWAIRDNKFGPGISNAMVNEGLAVAFSEIYTGDLTDGNSYTDDADNWVKEILLLPLDASYAQWVMGEHPDGRTYIGYRAGNYLIHKTMEKSKMNILELSELSPNEILKIGGY
jgi:tetratricopeptide (TPR) repeat protein